MKLKTRNRAVLIVLLLLLLAALTGILALSRLEIPVEEIFHAHAGADTRSAQAHGAAGAGQPLAPHGGGLCARAAAGHLGL